MRPNTISENNQTLVSSFRKPESFMKTQISWNSQQEGVLSPPNLNEHLMNKIMWAHNRISKTIRSSLQQAKNQVSFSNHCNFKSTANLNLRINATTDDQSARTQVPFSKKSKRSTSNFLKEKYNLKISFLRSSRLNFPYYST